MATTDRGVAKVSEWGGAIVSEGTVYHFYGACDENGVSRNKVQ